MSLLSFIIHLIRFIIGLILAVAALAIILLLAVPIGFYGMALYLEPTLPSVKEIKTAPAQMPLQIYSNDNLLIGQYGNRMSLPVDYNEIPESMIHAFLAAEDAYFFEHSGISVKGLGRAVTQLLTDDDSQTGGSTITMQVAKNYFLTPEQTFKRKLTELFLSRKIEQDLSKDEILTLYVNKIYLGEGSYGIKAAAKKYYSKSLDNLTLAEIAMLSGLPKAPSKYNPVVNPERALERRNWILGRMLSLGFITQQEHDTAVDAPIGLNMYGDKIDTEMPYLAEMARYSLVRQYGEGVMNSGWRVRLTVNSKVQHTADAIVQKRLLRYDRQHGWRGAEASAEDNKSLANFHEFATMHPAKVTKVGSRTFTAELKDGREILVPWSGMRWARKYYSANRVGGYPSRPSRIVTKGDIVRVSPAGSSWRLVQAPKIQGSLVSINPENGAIVALVGGFDYGHSKFNRATSGWRQPGSTIKPLIYSAALEKGYRPNSLVSDSPLRIGNWRPRNSDGRYYGTMTLRRALYLSRNLVSIRLLRSVGMANARNLLDQFGLDKEKLPTTLSLALGTGQASPLQMATAYSSFANGGHRIQPYIIEQIYDFNNEIIYQANPALACAVCFNDKLDELNEKQRQKIKTRLKDKGDNLSSLENQIADLEDELIDNGQQEKANEEAGNNPKQDFANLSEADRFLAELDAARQGKTPKAKKPHKKKSYKTDSDSTGDRLKVYPIEYQRAEQAPRILSPSVAYEMAGILRDVVQRGTATKAKALGRSDIGGKTGTTNNFKDAWFAGFHPSNVTIVWMGFDQPSTLGRRQYGGRLALPVWIDWMRFQLKDTPTQWVSLNNEAKSQKEKLHTIDITDSGHTDSSESDKDKEKPKLPQGTPYRRKQPPAVVSHVSSFQSTHRIRSGHSTFKRSTRTENSRSLSTTGHSNNRKPNAVNSKVIQSLSENQASINRVYTPPKTASIPSTQPPVYQPQRLPQVVAPKQAMTDSIKHQHSNQQSLPKPLTVTVVDEMPPMPE